MKFTRAIFNLFVLLTVSVGGRGQLPGQPAGNSRDSVHHGQLRFIGLGDWGRRGAPAQRRVAAAMDSTASRQPIGFVILTGDNFYENGVTDARDPQFRESFEAVYDQPSLQVPWFPVLGNHDYNLNPLAQVAYSRINPLWQMPAPYYDTSFAIGDDSLLLVFLDTYPMEKQILGSDQDTVKFPAGGVERQLAWLKDVLGSSHARWKLVVGHNPPHTGGSRRHSPRTRKFRRLVEPIFREFAVDLYLAGHEHHLEYLHPPGPTHYIISGAGSESRHVGLLKRYRHFAKRTEGFVVFTVDEQQLRFQFVDDHSRVLYTSTIRKER